MSSPDAPPALPPPRRIPPRNSANKSSEHLNLVTDREPPTLPVIDPPEISDGYSVNNPSYPIPKPRKPVPLPRGKGRKSPDSYVKCERAASTDGSEVSDVENASTRNGSRTGSGSQVSLSALEDEPPVEYADTLANGQGKIVSDSQSSTTTLPVSSSFRPVNQQFNSMPRNSTTIPSQVVRSSSDTISISTQNSNLIKWTSVEDALDEVIASQRSLNQSPDFWSIEKLELTPPDYSPPPPPDDLSISEDPQQYLASVEDVPPPLPPRPPRKESVMEDVIKPVPLPVGHRNSRHENEMRNAITTIYSGYLTVKFNQRDHGKRWCILKEGKISIFTDRKATSPKNIILCAEILEINAVEEKKNKLIAFGFEITTLKERSKTWSFYCETRDESVRWLCATAKSICDASGMYSTTPFVGCTNYDYGGKVFIRHGSSGEWSKCWLELVGRTARVFSEDQMEEIDLRKAMSFNLINADLYESKDAAICSDAVEKNPPFIITMPGKMVYVQADVEKQTMQWMKILQAKAKESGTGIEDQPLTGENIPVIIDRCMQFVSAHGLKSKGIYRHSGVSSKINSVLEMFAKDAHSCYLSREQFTEHDVAGALKRFLRQLPEPLICTELYQPLLHCSEIADTPTKLTKYRSLLNQLPRIPNYATLRKLLGHLKIISESAAENLMSVSNIAASFGSTLMMGSVDVKTIDETANTFDTTTKEITIFVDFLYFYETLFDVTEAETIKERKILGALEIIQHQLVQPRRAGDFLMGIYWEDRTSDPVNMRLSSKITAGELCRSLLERKKMPFDPSYSLHEIIFGEKLWRPVHYSEEVTSIILRWTEWNNCNICEYASNYLCVRKNNVYNKVTALIKTPLSITQQLRFAVAKDKTFKKVTVDFAKLSLTVYKSPNADKELGSWKVEEIVWFFGCSPQRSSPTKWNFTFIEKEKNTIVEKMKEYKVFFGNTICCDDEESLNKWIAIMIQAQFGTDLLPSVTNL